MRITRVCGVLLAAGAIALIPLPAHAVDGTTHVHPGQSIQAAIDAAAPGSTINVHAGTYRESLLITKELTLRGAGAGTGGTLLLAPATVPSTFCNGIDGVVAVCVVGTPGPAGFTPVGRVSISDLAIRDFAGNGVYAYATDRLTVTRTRMERPGDYGVAHFHSTRAVIAHNWISGAVGADIYVGDSPEAGTRVRDNTTTASTFGIMLRDSTDVSASNNTVTGNCLGIIALNTGGGATAGGEFSVRSNDVRDNSRVCPADDEGHPPVSGAGIVVAGAHDVEVRGNEVSGNRPAGPSFASGGVVVMSFVSGTTPVGNVIRNNDITDNQPVDISYDGTGSGNTFVKNDCGTALPATLC